ncbi:SAM-dependent methyltransferase [Amycolatopsis samaneae]|uniref:SAM-dependent methyltransferase n=1 Tax=Amycolatopsis samaneae TaxID=664691 RepID=A0ABW5GUP1_9PSEU
MTHLPDWVPPGIDLSKPSSARIYDYLLGGAHNFAVDREAAAQIERIMPGGQRSARLNRAFLRRAVVFMMEQGVRQFLDIGSGVPTVGNVHEIAHRADPEYRVLYVDRDAVAVAHSKLILGDNDRADVLRADMRDPESIMDSPEAKRLLDFDEPIGLLFLLMLHWVSDEDDPAGLTARYRDALASGSYLAITHGTEDMQPRRVHELTGVFRRARSHEQATTRSHDEVLALFGDFDLVEPGLVGCGNWRPMGPGDIVEDSKYNEIFYAGVARKP